MARTYPETEPRMQAQPPAAAPPTEAPTCAAAPTLPQTAHKAYELTDKKGKRAYVWWEGNTPIVDADDAVWRRRVQRALKKPIWSREDEFDEFGIRSDRFVLIQPDDPRYANRLLWRWDQLKIRDLESVDVVTLPDRQSVRRFSALHRAVAQRLGDTGMPNSASTKRA
jgi:hypothetical protein